MAEWPDLAVILITGHGEINTAVMAMQEEAYDFILKPMNPDLLELTIEKAIASIALRKEVQLLQEKYLKDHPTVYQWLCALAVYPSPNWEITIAIGRALEPRGVEVNFDNLL